MKVTLVKSIIVVLISIINLFSNQQLRAQDRFFESNSDRTKIPNDETKMEKKNIIKFSPLNLATLSYEISMERLFGKRAATQFSLSYFGHLKNFYYTRNFGYRILGEQRYYFNIQSSSQTKNYFALESYYMFKEFQQEQKHVVNVDHYDWFGSKYTYATDLFLIKRSYIAFAPKLGYQKQFENGFLVDCI